MSNAANPRLSSLSRDVVWNQLLFTAGYALTSGGFVSYFAADLGAKSHVIGWVLALPELVGTCAVFTPWLVKQLRGKKRLFLFASVAARLAALLIPLAIWLPPESAFSGLLGGMLLAGMLQAVAYTAYLSWLSDLAPEREWGRFFARRNMAHAAVLIFVPLLGSLLRDWLRNEAGSETLALTGYVVTFLTGSALQLASLLPLLKWPNSEAGGAPKKVERKPEAVPIEASHWPTPMRSFLFVLAFSYWLAFFQGLTQTAFFLHGYRQLQLSMTQYYTLSGTMYLLQMATAWLAGRWCDRHGYRNLLMGSTWLVGTSLLFWLASLDGRWLWLWGAYALWGGFGAVNLSLQNLVLKVIPRSRNTFPIAVYRFGSGGIAGLMGLAGGYWLEQQLALKDSAVIDPFLMLFAVSLAGRMLAPLWLLGVREPQQMPIEESLSEDDQTNQDSAVTRGR
ncbi:MFS transporter [bacterium]|nr:MFS transporter [bacterium]